MSPKYCPNTHIFLSSNSKLDRQMCTHVCVCVCVCVCVLHFYPQVRIFQDQRFLFISPRFDWRHKVRATQTWQIKARPSHTTMTAFNIWHKPLVRMLVWETHFALFYFYFFFIQWQSRESIMASILLVLTDRRRGSDEKEWSEERDERYFIKGYCYLWHGNKTIQLKPRKQVVGGKKRK